MYFKLQWNTLCKALEMKGTQSNLGPLEVQRKNQSEGKHELQEKDHTEKFKFCRPHLLGFYNKLGALPEVLEAIIAFNLNGT